MTEVTVYQIGDQQVTMRDIVTSHDVMALDMLATKANVDGAALGALSYIAAYRIYHLYKRVERAPARVLIRHLRMAAGIIPIANWGATALRTRYNEALFGWPSFNAWLEDWVSGAPVSRSSAWTKMQDIEGFRAAGCDWKVILDLLTNVPMAARDALQKPVQQEALPPGPSPRAQYFEELAALNPGQARKKVSEDAGEMQIYLESAKWVKGTGLLLRTRLSAPDGNYVIDLLVSDNPHGAQRSWFPVALWICKRLGYTLKIGGD